MDVKRRERTRPYHPTCGTPEFLRPAPSIRGLYSGRQGGGWKWTEWDLNPRLPPCEGGDLPLIYRPSRTMTNPGARNRFRCSCCCGRSGIVSIRRVKGLIARLPWPRLRPHGPPIVQHPHQEEGTFCPSHPRRGEDVRLRPDDV